MLAIAELVRKSVWQAGPDCNNERPQARCQAGQGCPDALSALVLLLGTLLHVTDRLLPLPQKHLKSAHCVSPLLPPRATYCITEINSHGGVIRVPN